MAELTPSDLTLLALASAEGQPLTPVQLQKSVFLMDKLLPPDALANDRFEFVAYNYGPFAQRIYAEARTLKQTGLVQIGTSDGDSFAVYSITQLGLERAEELSARIEPRVAEHCQKIVHWVRAQSFSSLLREVYKKFPDMAVNSVFKH